MLSAPGANPGGTSRSAPGTEVEVEVVEEHRAKPSKFSFVLPTDGRIETWVVSGDRGRHCKVITEPRSAGVHLDLNCGGEKDHELRVEATREFKPGKRVKIAEVTRPGGARSQVFVTLR